MWVEKGIMDGEKERDRDRNICSHGEDGSSFGGKNLVFMT